MLSNLRLYTHIQLNVISPKGTQTAWKFLDSLCLWWVLKENLMFDFVQTRIFASDFEWDQTEQKYRSKSHNPILTEQFYFVFGLSLSRENI